MRFSQRWTTATIFICTPLVACDSGRTEWPARSFQARDSAGVQIIENHLPAWAPGEEWVVKEEPRLEIGVVEGEGPYLLDRVRGLTLLDDGRIIIANEGDNTLRFYDPSGQFLHQVGGSGEGPDEFFQLLGLFRVKNELYATQFYVYPQKVFDTDGNFLRTLSPPTMMAVGVQGVFSDGSVLYRDWPQGFPTEEGAYLQFTSFVRVTPDGVVDTLASLPAVRYVNTDDGGPVYQAFGSMLRAAAKGETTYTTFGENPEIKEYDWSGALTRILRILRPPAPVTGQNIREYSQQVERYFSAEGMVYPDHHQAYRRLVVDSEDNLWAEQLSVEFASLLLESLSASLPEPSQWDVFDPKGVWLGVVSVPSRFRVFEIGDDFILGVWKDEMDVEFVRVYELVKRCREEAVESLHDDQL